VSIEAAPIVVRQAEVDDADAIADAHVMGWRVGYRGLFPDEYLDSPTFDEERRLRWRAWRWTEFAESQLFVVSLAGQVVGFGHCGRERPGESPDPEPTGRGEVYGFYVHPDAWGSGVATALMDVCIGTLRGSGYPAAILWVLRDNPRARAFYDKAGWRLSGEEAMWPGPQMPGVTTPQPVPEVQYLYVL
jgi:GNAT superfamily N-acetyltransferase